MRRFSVQSQAVTCLGIGIIGLSTLAFGADQPDLQAVWTASVPMRSLKVWNHEQLSKLKSSKSHEKDPLTGQLVRWKGVLVSDLIEKALEGVPNDQKALVDLIIFKNEAGGQAAIPRSLIVKYPVLLAYERDGHNLKEAGPGYGSYFSVIPWSSSSKILNEELPLEKYFIPDLTRIELGNYRERFSSLFLQRRTDPSAMRGEKLFVQNCVSCHAPAGGSDAASVEFFNGSKARVLASTGHPDVKGGAPKLSEKDRRSITSYFEAFQSEQSSGGHKKTSSQASR